MFRQFVCVEKSALAWNYNSSLQLGKACKSFWGFKAVILPDRQKSHGEVMRYNYFCWIPICSYQVPHNKYISHCWMENSQTTSYLSAEIDWPMLEYFVQCTSEHVGF